MMRFEGDREVPLSSAVVWQKLSDVRFLVQCIPDVESVSQVQADRAICTIRPGLAFVRGSLELTLQVVEAVPETNLRLLLHTKGIGSSSDVEATVRLTPGEQVTRIQWAAEVQRLGGLLRAVPQGLITAAAQKVMADVWTAVERRMRDNS